MNMDYNNLIQNYQHHNHINSWQWNQSYHHNHTHHNFLQHLDKNHQKIDNKFGPLEEKEEEEEEEKDYKESYQQHLE